MPVGVLLTDTNGKIVYKNRIAALLPEKSLMQAIQKNKNTQKIGNKTYKISRNETKDGTIVTFETTFPKEKIVKKEEKIGEKFKSICNNAPIGIVLLENNNVSFVNSVLERSLGYDSLELRDKLFDIVHPKNDKKIERLLSGKSQQLQLISKNKQNKWFEMGCQKINLNGSSQLIHAVDVTANKKMEIKLKNAQKKMQVVLEREKQFLEEISHYFFNPLCIAKGYLDLSIPYAEPPLKQKLEITKEAISRVENVVKHIVTEGRIYE